MICKILEALSIIFISLHRRLWHGITTSFSNFLFHFQYNFFIISSLFPLFNMFVSIYPYNLMTTSTYMCRPSIYSYHPYACGFQVSQCHNGCKCVVLWCVGVRQLRPSTSDFSTQGFSQGYLSLRFWYKTFHGSTGGTLQVPNWIYHRVFSRSLSHKWVCRKAAEV